jgi:hypothetical protein
MPPIASLLVDTPDVAVVRAWIQGLAVADGGMDMDAAGSFDAGDGGHHRDGGDRDADADGGTPEGAVDDEAGD